MTEMKRPEMAAPLETVIDGVEQANVLDGPAGALQRLLRKVFPADGALTKLLRGGPLGHPAHPALILVPAGAWTSATILDLLAQPKAARRLTAIGCLSAIPAAAAGAVDFAELDGPRRRVAIVHALVNNAALTCYTMSWFARRRGGHVRGIALSMLGAGFVTVGGWLGGHLAYSQGVGVDTSEFRQREAHDTQSRHADHRAPSYA
jgi:uncharacterized membrane protein